MSTGRLLGTQIESVRKRVLIALAWYSIATHRGITRYAHKQGWILAGGFVRAGSITSDLNLDGAIAVMGVNPSLDEELPHLNVPIVNIGYDGPKEITSVAADSFMIGEMAAQHFLSRGFQNLAYYLYWHKRGDDRRLDGFREAAAKAGRRVQVIGPIADVPGSPGSGIAGSDRGFDRLRYIGDKLSQLPKPLAVFGEYDDRAVDIIDAAMLRGLRVPEQIAILGVDNDELRCPFTAVPLSSIDNDEERIGYEAAKILDGLMKGQSAPLNSLLIPPKGVVVRQSTNTLAIPHANVARALRLIWEHYTESIDVTWVADQIPLSYPQLHTEFVKHVGHTMADELTRRRIEHAQRLLVNTDAKLSRVAEQAGFGSADRMGRVFTRKLKITPSEYRDRNTMPENAAEAIFDSEEPQVITARPALLELAEERNRL